ncbi:MAG: hypothetical protein U0L26_01210 [Cellulosilyticum sp.]|nr:hypothetical protein [Cellulosilyticum sp.]MEE1071007.1 hypothetical protein [Cellulosilyticum sp.]
MSRYKEPAWRQLDNAAKIFPTNSNKYDTKVFRFSCRLKEMVQPRVLQKALDKTMHAFPLYASIIRKGLFWYYFESSDIKPIIKQENHSPCGQIYDENIKGLLFEVTYYKKRINLEVHHALTDGVGALQFLKTLVLNYLVMVHADVLQEKNLSIDYDASLAEREVDGFSKYSSKAKGSKKASIGKAYKFKGERIDEDFLQVINGQVSVKQVLGKAHEYKTTITIYLIALLIQAIGEQMSEREKKRPVVVSVPVNLRPYFQSASARNFFSVVLVPYRFGKSKNQLEDIIDYLKVFFDKELKTEKFQARINHLVALEKNYVTRAVPLILKRPTLKLAHYFNNEEVTTSFSNTGKVIMPDEVVTYIDGFDFCVSTRKIQVCLCSFGDQLSISFTSPFVNTEVQKYFFRALTKQGIRVVLSTNLVEE